jgi:hypothetical protein
MDIVYKKGAVNHADALTRRPNLKDSLHKLKLLREWTNDEAKCELHAQIFPLESRLHLDYGHYAEIKNAYDSDKYLLIRKSLSTLLVRQSKGLLYALRTSVLAVQHSRSWCLRCSCRPAVPKSDKVKGRRKVSINIRSKKFGKYVQVVDSSHRLPSVLARCVERCRPTNFEQKSRAVGVEGHVK